MTVTAGAPTFASTTATGRSSSAARTVLMLGRPALLIVAAGVRRSRPPSIRACATAGSRSHPHQDHHGGSGPRHGCPVEAAAGSSGATCPETTVPSWVICRWVTGIPASSGAATLADTPGMTRTGMRRQRTPGRASSPPRPKTKLSPPLNRATQPGVLDADPVDPFLVGELAAVADVDENRVGGRLVETGQGREPVIDHDVSLPKRGQPGHGEQARIARTTAEQHHRADLIGVLFTCRLNRFSGSVGWPRRTTSNSPATSSLPELAGLHQRSTLAH